MKWKGGTSGTSGTCGTCGLLPNNYYKLTEVHYLVFL